MGTPQRPQRPQRPSRPQNQGQIQGQNQQNNPYSQQNNPYNQQNNPYNQQGYSQQDFMSDEQMVQAQMQQRKKKTIKTILIIFGIIVFIAVEGVLGYFIATGRISQRVPELESEVANWEKQYDNLMISKNSEIEKLKEAVNEMTIKEVIPTTSLQRIKGQYVQELWLIEDDFIAPNSLDIPNVSDAVNDSFIQIGTAYTFRPSDRWTMVSQGTTWEFTHPNKIWGKIRALNNDTSSKEILTDEGMREIVQKFFVSETAKYPNLTDITYRKIFYDNYQFGIIARAEFPVYYTEDEDINYQILNGDGSVLNENAEGIEIPEGFDDKNTKKMTINVGFVTIGKDTLSFIFLYDSEGGNNSQELIDLLLKSCTLGQGGKPIKLE